MYLLQRAGVLKPVYDIGCLVDPYFTAFLTTDMAQACAPGLGPESNFAALFGAVCFVLAVMHQYAHTQACQARPARARPPAPVAC